jgi:KDO2-lipid IV(A) lauroyltransferase
MGNNVKNKSREHFRKRVRSALKEFSGKMMFNAVSLLGIGVLKLSRKQTRWIAFMIGDFMHRVLVIRRELVYRNLILTFPDKSREEIRRIATSMYRNVASSLLEVLRLPLIRNREDAAALVDIEGEEFLRWYSTRKTGAVFVSAHYGNWELMAMACGLLVQPIAIVVKRLRNELIDRQMNEYRTMRGNRIIYHSKALREGLRLLQEGGFLTILGDQSDPDAVNFGEFLGRRATMYYGPAFFALKADVPLFFTICTSNGDGRYTITVSEIKTSDLSCNKDDIATLVTRYTRAIEEQILLRPEEWFWLHNRWKRG